VAGIAEDDGLRWFVVASTTSRIGTSWSSVSSFDGLPPLTPSRRRLWAKVAVVASAKTRAGSSASRAAMIVCSERVDQRSGDAGSSRRNRADLEEERLVGTRFGPKWLCERRGSCGRA
jgi:hypothetical protein